MIDIKFNSSLPYTPFHFSRTLPLSVSYMWSCSAQSKENARDLNRKPCLLILTCLGIQYRILFLGGGGVGYGSREGNRIARSRDITVWLIEILQMTVCNLNCTIAYIHVPWNCFFFVLCQSKNKPLNAYMQFNLEVIIFKALRLSLQSHPLWVTLYI